MQFTMVVKHEGDADSDTWEEKEDRMLKHDRYPQPDTDAGAQAWAEACLQRFNDTLRPGERPRVLVRVDVQGLGSGLIEHHWVKVSLVTEAGGYDRMKCSACDITGKRYGVGPNTKRDSKYRGGKYVFCTPKS